MGKLEAVVSRRSEVSKGGSQDCCSVGERCTVANWSHKFTRPLAADDLAAQKELPKREYGWKHLPRNSRSLVFPPA
jgi:hypothetical protein